jgi:hypothetical protein
MAHYAYLDENNIVTQVIVGRDEDDLVEGVSDWIGYSYDADRDAFIPPKPFESWVLHEESCLWWPPVPMPVDGKLYQWNEEAGTWEEVPLAEAS